MDERTAKALTTVLYNNKAINLDKVESIIANSIIKNLSSELIIDVFDERNDEFKGERKRRSELRDMVLYLLNKAAETSFNDINIPVNKQTIEYEFCDTKFIESREITNEIAWTECYAVDINKYESNLIELQKLNSYLVEHFNCCFYLKDLDGWLVEIDNLYLYLWTAYGVLDTNFTVSHWGIKQCPENYTIPTVENLIEMFCEWSPAPTIRKTKKGTMLFLPN